MSAGLDPKLLNIAIRAAIYYVEGGVREFVDFAQQAIAKFGDSIRIYLRSAYDAVRGQPGIDEDSMTPFDEVRRLAPRFTNPPTDQTPTPPADEKPPTDETPPADEAPVDETTGEVTATEEAEQENVEGTFVPYQARRLNIEGAKEHPSKLVESAAMASVLPPVPTYQPKIPKALIAQGIPSIAQLEPIIYAGQAHQQMLPAKAGETPVRKGYFDGDGTGVGKGVIAAGIILDNWMQGRKKAIWISESKGLILDARRDWSALKQDPKQLMEFPKKKGKILSGDGILFTTYDTLKMGFSPPDPRKTTEQNEAAAAAASAKGPSRLSQIAKWLPKDFDGVIVFDEAHNMGNALEQRKEGGGGRSARRTPPAKKALAGVELQKMFPNARVVYLSATGATEVSNLSYLTRLGLWGEGSAFKNVRDFINRIASAGLTAMEIVARDMKALGLYTSRSLSYDGVEYKRLEHTLTAPERENYETLAEAWRVALANMDEAMEISGAGNDPAQKTAMRSAFWSAHQRFFNQLITSIQMTTAIKAAKKDVAEGRQVIFQLVNTDEAQLDRAKAKLEEGEELEELDLSPKDALIDMVRRAYPVQVFQPVMDPETEAISWVAQFHPDGTPIEDPELVAARDALLRQLDLLNVPDGPLDVIINTLGYKDVAEVTGRSRRVVENDEGKRVEQSRSPANGLAETEEYQDGKRPYLVFSGAGSTGRSFHAARGSGASNKRRSHYLVQAGWRADKAVQGFGRSHRTNQESAPIFTLVHTDLQGQKRFISSIARRLAQLGALTKGQRETGDQGVFSAADNLESQLARDAFRRFLQIASTGQGYPDINFREFARQTALTLTDQNGALLNTLPPIERFLNRLLSLDINMQNTVFNRFSEVLEAQTAEAIQNGTADRGVEEIKGTKIELLSDEVIHTYEDGNVLRDVSLEVTTPTNPGQWIDLLHFFQPDAFFQSLTRAGNPVYGIRKSPPHFKDGVPIERRGIRSVLGYDYVDAKVFEDKQRWRQLTRPEAEALWRQQFEAAPEFEKSTKHLLTGTLLPAWGLMPWHNVQVKRAVTNKGKSYIGVALTAQEMKEMRRNFGAAAKGEDAPATSAAALQAFLDGRSAILRNGWMITRRRVGGDNRIEITGVTSASEGDELTGARVGIFAEKFGGRWRYFIPTNSTRAYEWLTKKYPVVEWTDAGGSAASVTKTAEGAAPIKLPPGTKKLTDDVSVLTKPETEQQRETLRREVVGAIRRMSGGAFDLDIFVVVDRAFKTKPDGTPISEVDGLYFDDTGHIVLTLQDADTMGTARHETMHLLRRLGGFTDAQWAALQRRAAEWRVQFEVEKRWGDLKLTEEQKDEEAIAEAFRAWAAGTLKVPTGIRAAFETIKRWLEAFRAILGGAKLRDAMTAARPAEDIFQRIVEGEVGRTAGERMQRALVARWDALDEADLAKGTDEDFRPLTGADMEPAAAPRLIDTITEAFKRWFGESVVVDENGDPKRVYHGTVTWENDGVTFGDIETFDRLATVNKIKGRKESMNTVGSWFSSEPGREGASMYSGGSQGAVYPVYLSIKDPWRPRSFDHFLDAFHRTAGRDPKTQNPPGIGDAGPLRAWLKKMGHDGIYFPAGMKIDGTGQDIWIALEPSQIKSAVSNVGTYDRNDPNITASPKRPGPPLRDTPDGKIDLTDQGEQHVMPGMERMTAADMAKRQTAAELRAKLKQRGLEDLPLFGKGGKQDTLFSVKRTPMTPQQENMRKAVFADVGRESLGQRITNYWNSIKGDAALRLKQGIADYFAAWDAAERTGPNAGRITAKTSGVEMARKIANLDGIMATILGIRQINGTHVGGGGLQYNAQKGILENIKGPNAPRPFLQIFAPIFKAGLQDQWASWMVANRAERLKAEKRENLVDDAFITEFKDLDRRHIVSGRNIFREAQAEWTKLNRSILDLGEQTGTINPQIRALFENADYVPFYRVMDDANPDARGRRPSDLAKSGSGIQRLYGGKEKLGDIYENMVMNMTKIVDGAIKNEAKRRAEANLQGTGILEKLEMKERMTGAHVSAGAAATALRKIGVDVDKMSRAERDQWLEIFVLTRPKDPDVINVMHAGKSTYYRVTDPLTLRSFTAMHPVNYDAVTRLMGASRRLFTNLITTDPVFMISNTMRDTIHSWVVTGSDAKPGIDAIRGALSAARYSPSLIALLSGGAVSAQHYNVKPGAVRSELEQKAGIQHTIINSAKRGWGFLQYMGMVSEMATRIAVYDAAIKAGKGEAQALSEAQDVTNFTMRGDWAAIRFLAETVPFFNARLQGLYRMGRGAAENPKRFLMRGSMVMAAAIALWAANHDDERWKALEDWDKNSYFHFFVGGMHFRFPKPFEIGALFATIPEMMLDYSDDGREKVVARRIGQMFMDTLSFNPFPQAIAPAVDLISNRDSFTGRPIVSQAFDRLKPEAQYGPHTSNVAIGMGSALGLSPEQIEFAINGYLGTMGTYALGVADVLADRFSSREKPTRRWDQFPLVRRFMREEPALGSKWLTEFYDLKKKIDEVYATDAEYRKRGLTADAAELRNENRAELAARESLTGAAKQMTEIRREMRRIQDSSSMTADAKRSRLDELMDRRNRIAAGAIRPVISRLEGATP